MFKDVFLSHRNETLIELMDDEKANPAKLTRTFQAFRTINNLLSFWHTIYQKDIKPVLSKSKMNTIADVGCGDGYLLQQIGDWAKKDGFECALTGIEPDERALKAVNFKHSIRFIHSQIEEISEVFDIIISNHVLHHLPTKAIHSFLEELENRSNTLVVINDIHRSLPAFVLFPFIGIWFAFHTFLLIDGLYSIRKSFTKSELQKLELNHWIIESPYPFRLVLKYAK